MSRYLEVSLQLHERHFALLRLAHLRRLYVAERMSGGLYSVPSYSRKSDNLHWIVTRDTCSCPAIGYCTHRAVVVNDYYMNEAEPREYLTYMHAQREDFAALELRVLHGEETRDDKAFVRPLVEKVRERQAPAEVVERAGAPF